MISFDSDVIDAITSDSFQFAHMVALPGSLYFTDHGSDLSYDGNEYISNGVLQGLSTVSQTQAISLSSYSLTLSNVDRSVAQGYTATNYRGHPATIYLAIIGSGAIVGTPTVIYRGTLDTFSVKESRKTSSLGLKLTSHWASFNQKGGRYTSDSVQQSYSSGDRFFKHAHVESTDALAWGKR